MNVYACGDEPAPPLPADCTGWVLVPYEPSPFALDLPAAQSLSVAIIGVWALAWLFRTLARAVRE